MAFEPTSGDRAPSLLVTVLRKGIPVVLTGRTLKMVLEREELPPVTRSVALASPSTVVIEWQDGELLQRPNGGASRHNLQIVVDEGLPTQETSSALTYVVRPRVA